MKEGTFASDFTVPSVWPPASNTPIFEGRASGALIRLIATTSGTFRAEVKAEADALYYEYPRLLLPDFPFIKLAFAWAFGTPARLALNDRLFSEESSYGENPIPIEAKSQPPTGFRSPIDFCVPDKLNEFEHSFLHSILDLQSRVAKNDRFDLLQASAIIRRLLLDSHPLLHLVNRSRRQQIRFPFTQERQVTEPEIGPVFTFLNFTPEFADPIEVTYLSLDQFLGQDLLRDQARSFTVKEVVLVCANIKGGVHFDENHSPSTASLISLDKSYLPFFVDASLAALPSVAWSLIWASQPLIAAILAGNPENP